MCTVRGAFTCTCVVQNKTFTCVLQNKSCTCIVKNKTSTCVVQKVYMCNVCVRERESGGIERKRDREREIEKKEVIKCFTSKSN